MSHQIENFVLNWPVTIMPLAIVWYIIARLMKFKPTSLLRIISASIPGLVLAAMYWLISPAGIFDYLVESALAVPTNLIAPLIIAFAAVNKTFFPSAKRVPKWIETALIALLVIGYVYDQVAIYSLGIVLD